MWRRWYHGRLDRYGAEARLREYGKLGGYLVRESDRKPGSYVLSYLGRTGINHFRITAVCGDFYIGGRQFESLSYLVAYLLILLSFSFFFQFFFGGGVRLGNLT